MSEKPPIKLVPGSGGLHASGLGKRYKKRPVVRNVSLSLQRGEAVGLLGPNGAGKTTTFYMITGLVQPDEGRVMMDGHDVTMLPMYSRARLGLGYLPQEASIFRGLTRICAAPPRWRFPVVNGGAAKSPAPWRRILRISFWMNRWLALIPSRLAKFVIW